MPDTPLNPAPASDLTRRLQAQHDRLVSLRFEVARTLRDNARVRARAEAAYAQRHHGTLRPLTMPPENTD
jgi:hypothetical protein